MIKIGIKNRLETVSTQENSAESLGSGNVPVFATISMIGLMEKTCLESVLPFLESGQDTVGVHVNVSHCKATPAGMKVWCESELVEICLLAAGFAELYFEIRLMPWDYATASLILTEAGGAVCDFNGEAPSMFKPSMFIAANTKDNCQGILDTIHRHLDKLPY